LSLARSAFVSFSLKLIIVVGLVFGFAFLVTFPTQSYGQTADSNPGVEGLQGFSGAETHPDGYRFAWALKDASLIYAYVPRYTPLNLRLRLNLQRPADAPPAHLEIYERTVDPVSDFRLVTALDYNPAEPGPRDYYVTIPSRAKGGEGLVLELRSNTFRVGSDRRDLGFIFLNANLTMPRTHLVKLFWPYPYWLAGLVLLGAIAAWGLRAGLSLFDTILLSGLTGFSLVSVTGSTYQYGWWLLLVAGGVWLFYGWEGWRLAKNRPESLWPLFGAAALLCLFFLFSSDTYFGDISYYFHWSASIHQYGIWNIYSHDEILNYLPLIVYVLSIYNLVVYPLGLQENPMAWRVVATLMFLAVVWLVYLTEKAVSRQETDAPKVRPNKWLLIVALNASLLYNPVVWGQSDMGAVLVLLAAFYLIYRRVGLWGGLVLGLVAISKPQAWFVLPLLAWMLVQHCGWKRGSLGLLLGGGVALVLSGIAFGLDLNSVIHYFSNPQFAGEYSNEIPTAFNLNYLLLGTKKVEPPLWLSLSGFVVVGAVLLGLLYSCAGRNQTASRYGQAIALQVVSCFTWLIKMKERYLIYGLPFLGLAAVQQRRLFKPFLLLSWFQLVQLVMVLFQYGRSRTQTLAENFQWWSWVLSQPDMRRLLSFCDLLLFFYLGFVYLKEVGIFRGKTKLAPEALQDKPEVAAR
jgi:Gpi18-like mannosyltransferase